MFSAVRNFALATLAAAISFSFIPSNRAHAQTYQIDCAILLCLAGGWPASEPCARARAEFIRRITPWPVEPPLQIWRCPMAVSYEPEFGLTPSMRLYDVYAGRSATPLPYFFPTSPQGPSVDAAPAILRTTTMRYQALPEEFALQLAQDRADIDISGSEFNFVRSIRVFDVRIASQRIAGENDQCRRFASVRLGAYGLQGEFVWQVSDPSAVPEAHIGLEGWGVDCPTVSNRSVFVDWRDYEGNYGFEQVDY